MDKNRKTAELENELLQLKTKISELEALVKFYEEQFRIAKRKQFGPSSERTDVAEQLGLFDEPENTADKKLSEPALEEITYKRKKRIGKRDDDLFGLPVETIEYALSKNEQICSECGDSLHEMTKEIRRELTIIPARVKVTEHVGHIYSCRNCEKNGTSTPIIKAPSSGPVIKGSLASPSAVAHIMVQKYVNAVPLYRQEQEFLRNGVALSRQTMANWMIRCAEDWLAPVYEKMRQRLLAQMTLHADETVLQVLNEPGKKANTNSYMWLYRTSRDVDNPIVLYEYQPTRSGSHPKRFLEGFNGYLHTDGYSGYHNLPQSIIIVSCWAHARRKFDEALKAMPLDKRKDSACETGLDFCNQLFKLEREFQELSNESRYEARCEKSLPIAEAFLSWEKSVGVLPKSALGKAIHYLVAQWPYLKNVFQDGRLELSNNRAERSIKPFVIGRKNWLFSNTQKGAKASSVIYSIIETAKENNLNPFKYIKFLLEVIPNSMLSELDGFLPDGSAVPDYCKM